MLKKMKIIPQDSSYKLFPSNFFTARNCPPPHLYWNPDKSSLRAALVGTKRDRVGLFTWCGKTPEGPNPWQHKTIAGRKLLKTGVAQDPSSRRTSVYSQRSSTISAAEIKYKVPPRCRTGTYFRQLGTSFGLFLKKALPCPRIRHRFRSQYSLQISRFSMGWIAQVSQVFVFFSNPKSGQCCSSKQRHFLHHYIYLYALGLPTNSSWPYSLMWTLGAQKHPNHPTSP